MCIRDRQYAEPLRALASDLARLVNHLADTGYGWQSGGLPALRAGNALTEADPQGLVGLGSLEIKKGGMSLLEGAPAQEAGTYLATLGWSLTPEGTVAGATKSYGPLRGAIRLEQRPEGRERLWIEVAPD